ncbi:MAG: hypothetical protein WC121_08010 [Candidatus Kapaibacterium sp.]
MEYVQIIVTIVLAVIGWIIAHRFTNFREIAQKRRELTTKVLIDSYYVLTNDIAQRELTDERTSKLEFTLSQIQLFGTEEQVDLVWEFIQNRVNRNEASLDPLIKSLRNSLREDLNLSRIDSNVSWIRHKKEDLDSI